MKKIDKKELAYLSLIVAFTAVVFFAAGAYCADLFEISRFKATEIKYVQDTAPSKVTTTTVASALAYTTDTSSVETSHSTETSVNTTLSSVVTTTTVSTTSKVVTTTTTETVSTTTIPSTTLGRVNLNTATKEELMTIKGIGEVYATRIIEYRELIGYFTCLEELLEVKGIGEKRLAQWAPYLTV